MLYRGKGKIHSEIELIIYLLNCYSPTSIISLALLVLSPKLVLPNPVRVVSLLFLLLLLLLLFPCLRDTASFILPRHRKSRVTRHYTTVIKTSLTYKKVERNCRVSLRLSESRLLKSMASIGLRNHVIW